MIFFFCLQIIDIKIFLSSFLLCPFYDLLIDLLKTREGGDVNVGKIHFFKVYSSFNTGENIRRRRQNFGFQEFLSMR